MKKRGIELTGLRRFFQSDKNILTRFVSKKIILIFLAVLGIGVIIYLFAATDKEDCDNDLDCFDNYVSQCKRAEVRLVKDNSVYLYTLKGSSLTNFNNCVMKVKLVESLSDDFEIIGLLEGKSMNCYIPKEKFASLEGTDKLIQYCSGPLKEGISELALNRLYGIVVKNLGNAVVGIGEFIEQAKK